MNHDEKLIPELKDWRKVNGVYFSIDNWLSCEGSMSLAIGFSFLFWPDFIEHDGCVFIKDRFSKDIYNNLKKSLRDKTYSEIELLINHIHIADLFARGDMSRDQIVYLGQVLQKIYSTKLNAEFPEKKFIVEFNGDELYEDHMNYQLILYQEINDSRIIFSA